MKINIAGKELNIKYAYKPTLKEHVISKVVKMAGGIKSAEGSEAGDLEGVEDILLYIPELLLVGMQVHHKDYRYDYDTGEGKSKQLDRAFSIVEKYMDGEDADPLKLFEQLQEALVEESFLANLFRKEEAEQEKLQKKTSGES